MKSPAQPNLQRDRLLFRNRGRGIDAGGLLVWKEHWVLSWKAILLGTLLILVAGFIATWKVHSFLAVNRPLGRGLLVVEGWIPPHTIHQAAAAYGAGNYRQVIVVRPLYEGEPGVMHGQVAGDYAKTVLVRNGIPTNRVTVLLFPGSERDRTFHSAVATREWLRDNGGIPEVLDVVTIGPHARRSRLLYQEAFGKTTDVGALALQDPRYDPARWWRSSEGVREVLSETFAYAYAKMIPNGN